MANLHGSSSLQCFVKQLENEISEVEKTILFRSNILKWAIKSDNFEMCLNLAQIIILKTDELQMLTDVRQDILNWQSRTSEVEQSQYEEILIKKFKTAFHLMEEVPTAATYAAFNKLVAVFSDANTQSCDRFQLRPVSTKEKKAYVKKFISESCAEVRVPDRIYNMLFGGDETPRGKMTARDFKTMAPEDRRPSSVQTGRPPTPPPKPSIPSASVHKAWLESVQTQENNRVPSSNLTNGQQNLTYSQTTGSRKGERRSKTPNLPSYYQKLSQPNLWLHRTSDNNGISRCSSANLWAGMSTTPLPSEDVEEIQPIQMNACTQDAKSRNNNSIRKHFDAPGRSRAGDERSYVTQKRNAMESPRSNCFPPLELLTQLRQQESESAQTWLSRIESQLGLYLQPSCQEYEVILRWLLSCGQRRKESVTASTSLTLNELLVQLTVKDDHSTSRSVTSRP